jgi:hypothetical protein
MLAGVAVGQDYRAKVQGFVSDTTQSAVLSAKVTLKNMETGFEAVKETEATGRYAFDFVIPGTYSVTVEVSGFNKWTQENIVVQTRGDITVNATLTVGAVAESVTVSGAVAAVQFNSSTMTTMVTGQLLKDIPVLARNPFTLALLNPAVINRYWDVSHRNPFYMWSNAGMDMGGQTGGKNDQLLDGVPLGYAARGSYNAPMDAVQEVAVQQNAVDAEFGFSAGGVLNLSMKSGTNDFHGTAYYFGRNPAMNAVTNRLTRDVSVVRNHIWGGTIGGPVVKNKIFFYSAYEQWRATQPSANQSTVPTDLERRGDFSQTRTASGATRLIYDPFTTQYDPATGVATRLPFANNIIPQNRIDPTGNKVVNLLWKPNNPGNDASGINNFYAAYAWWLKYWNISERVDYNVTDKLRMYARFSKFQTRLDNPNWGDTIAVRSDNGGIMDALNAAMDVLYLVSPRTTINFRYGAIYLEDDYDSEWAKVGESVWADLFPTGWYKPVLAAVPAVYFPSFSFTGNGSASAGLSGWWQVHGRAHTPSVTLTHDRGKHHLKTGWQWRYSYDDNAAPNVGSMAFHAVDTGNTFVNFDARGTGSQFASALLGVLNSGNGNIQPGFNNSYHQWGLFLQDDIRLTRDITLNLGLRWEQETAPKDDHLGFSRNLDLTNPIPELQGKVTMPPQVTAISNIAYQYNGAWNFTDDSTPRVYPSKNNFLPRVGIAIRLNDQSALRFGWARYAVPFKGAWTEGLGAIPYDGFSQNTLVEGPVQGVPRALVSDPFPSTNPLRPPVGKGRGRYTNLGNPAWWFYQDLKRSINDRFNASYQRSLPAGVLLDTTFFMNFGHNALGTSMWGGSEQFNRNMIDPNLVYQHKGAVDASVANPFYLLLSADQMPGVRRNQATIAVRELLRQYPQYGDLNERLAENFSTRYYALQIKADRRFSQGISMTLGYNYNRERRSLWYDDRAQFANDLTLMDTREPRHNVRIAGTWEVPVGRGRKYLTSAPRLVDAIVGGWSTSHILFWNNGPRLTFPAQNAPSSSPKIDNPTRDKYFETSGFSQLAAYTPRSNPWYYDDLRGFGYWNLDSTISKNFHVTERVRFELRMEFFNMPNAFMPSQPILGVTSSTFGKSTSVAGGNYGREIQYTGRIHF